MIQFTQGGSIRVTQLSSGTAIEILPDGTILLHSENAITMSAPTQIKMTCGASSLELTPGNIKAKSPRIDLNCHGSVLAAGSPNIFVNGLEIARIGDPVACGSAVATGSGDVFANG